ncbi:hypothetical protein [Azohydromonas caseinilytica]|uniref:Fucose-binding lectin n=1 Tax=Azohydromonas caseinilytica TaxID=2728836 RepID=A0A848FE77_9BURK|nr:hypothetical protein [Azohydromonas caseinilytica]NML16583.1 hypothetical protein [Azohydromonas caseinilytica]
MSQFAFSTSAVSWNQNGTHLRIYTSDGAKVTEKCWDGGWSAGGFVQEGQAVGATSWQDGSGQIHIRAYVANQGKVTEYCWDRDHWYVGAFPATPGSAVSATAWQDGALHLRVYVTQPNGRVAELCWDGNGPWYPGAYQG